MNTTSLSIKNETLFFLLGEIEERGMVAMGTCTLPDPILYSQSSCIRTGSLDCYQGDTQTQIIELTFSCYEHEKHLLRVKVFSRVESFKLLLETLLECLNAKQWQSTSWCPSVQLQIYHPAQF